MAINKFDSPAQDRYFNTNVQFPYEQLMGTVAARQAQLDREQELVNKNFEDTQNIRYIPGSKDEQYVRNYISKSSDLVNKYSGADFSDPIVKQQMRSEFAKITNKQDIRNIETSHAAWAANQKYKAELKSKGLYDPMIDDDPANANWDTIGGGKTYDYIAPAFKNPRPSAEQYFNNIQDSDLPSEGGYLMRGVTKDKINQVAGAKWNEFSNTSEGNLYIKKVARENGLDYNNKEVREKIAIDYLTGVGEEFIRKNRTGEDKVSAKRNDIQYENTTREQTIRSKDNFDPLGIGKPTFRDDGSVFVPDMRGAAHTRSGYGSVSGVIPADNKYRREATDEEKALSAKLTSFRASVPSLKGLNDRDTYRAYMDLTKDGKAFPDLPTIDLPEVPRESIANYLASSLTNRNLKVMDDYGSSDLRVANDDRAGSPLRDLGYNAQTLKAELIKFAKNDPDARVTVAGLAQNGDESGMIQLEVQDISRKGSSGSKGKTRKLYISSAGEVQGIMAPINNIYENVRNFKSGITPVRRIDENTQEAVRVIPDAKYNESTQKWEYDYKLEGGYLSEDGQFEYVAPTTLDAVRLVTTERLKNSRFINTEIGYTKDSAPSF